MGYGGSVAQRNGAAGVNDSPVDCQSRRVTEPQREGRVNPSVVPLAATRREKFLQQESGATAKCCPPTRGGFYSFRARGEFFRSSGVASRGKKGKRTGRLSFTPAAPLRCLAAAREPGRGFRAATGWRFPSPVLEAGCGAQDARRVLRKKGACLAARAFPFLFLPLVRDISWRRSRSP